MHASWDPLASMKRHVIDACICPVIALYETSRKLTDESIRGGVTAHAVNQQCIEAVCQLIGVPARLEPRVGPVGCGERQQRRGRVVQIGPELAELAALGEERAHAVLVPPPLGEDLV